jgi:hypothetical protein
LLRPTLLLIAFVATATVSRASLERPAPEAAAIVSSPGGRLSVAATSPTSGNCNPTSDIAAATVVYYSPCNHRYVQIYNGTRIKAYDFTSSATDSVGMILVLGASWAPNTLHDVYVTLQDGRAPVLCTVPWKNSTAGASARATDHAPFGGYQTNATLIGACHTSNTSTISVAQNQATYLGFFYTNAAGGQVDLKFGTMGAGGGAACICVWNMYNQIDGGAVVQESASSWAVDKVSSYEPLNARAGNGGLGNRITFISGNASSPIDASYSVIIDAAAGESSQYGVALNQTNAVATKCPPVVVSQSAGNSSAQRCLIYPAAGLNFLQAIQWATSTDAAKVTFRSSSPSAQALSARYKW